MLLQSRRDVTDRAKSLATAHLEKTNVAGAFAIYAFVDRQPPVVPRKRRDRSAKFKLSGLNSRTVVYNGEATLDV